MNRRGVALLLSALSLLTVAVRSAETRDRDAFSAVRAKRLAAFRAAAESFEAKLAQSPDELHGTAAEWHELVGWGQWGPDLLAGKGPTAATLQPHVRQFYGSHPGLVDSTVDRLRLALAAYLDLQEAQVLAEDDVGGVRADAVATVEAATDPSFSDFEALESAVWWLRAVDEASDLVAAASKRFDGPMIVTQIDRQYAEAKLAAIERETKVVRQGRHRVQAALIRGESTINARLTAELQGDDEARLRFSLVGTVDSPKNLTTAGSVKVSSESHSTFNGAAEIRWAGDRFVASEPKVDAQTRSTVHEIDAPRTIRYAAEKRIRENHSNMERAVAKLVAQQVVDTMNERLNPATEMLNSRAAGMLAWLSRSGIPAAQWRTRLTPNSLAASYRPRTAAGLGAPTTQLPRLSGDDVASISFYDGAIESILGPQLAGAEWRDADFAKVQRELTGGNTEPLLVGLDPPRWGVQWAWRLPVQLHYARDSARLTYRFQRVDVGDEQYAAPCRVVMEFDVGASPYGHEIRRRGPVVVEAIDPEQPVPEAVESLLESRFARPVGEPYHRLGLQFPAGGQLYGLAGFRASGAELADHWIHLKYAFVGSTSEATQDAAE